MEIKDIVEKYKEDILLFNKIVSNGRDIEDFFVDELIDRLKLQVNITKEEVDETIKARVENDLVGYYDGLADVIFTSVYLINLEDVLIKKWNIGGVYLSSSEFIRELGNSIVDLLTDKGVNMNLLDKCVELVVENNKQKFTTSKEELDTWESEFIRKELIVDGVTYYTLVDDKGKIRKRDGFKAVDLSFVLDEV